MPASPALAPDIALPGPAFPDKLRAALPLWVLGTEEEGQQRALAAGCARLAASDPDFLAPAAAMALRGFQERPLSHRWRKALEPFAGVLPAPAARLLAALKAQGARPPEASDMETLLGSGEHGLAVKHLLPRLKDPANGPFWLGLAWDWLLRLDQGDLPRSMLDLVAWGDLAPLKERHLAHWAFHALPPDQALPFFEALDGGLWGWWRDDLSAELLLRLGERDKAASLLAGLLSQAPFMLGWMLRLHALRRPQTPDPDPGPDTAVLLYSWNKADLLERTLESLAASRLGGAMVCVLDNGSTDRMAEVLAAGRGRFPEGRFAAVRLPVNLGAPAARNWLLSLPEARSCRRLAFLDDDVEVPPDWLARLLAEAEGLPRFGAVGCRIVSADRPTAMQSADYNLLPAEAGAGGIQGVEERIHVFDTASGSLDQGQFAYRRPCLHVSGCCHVLSRESLEATGDFDVRFAPTQFDDLERDLRAGLSGFPAFYVGDVAVRHVQHSSLARATTTAAMAQVFGNRIKLEAKYGDAEARRLFAENNARLWEDANSRSKDLEEG